MGITISIQSFLSEAVAVALGAAPEVPRAKSANRRVTATPVTRGRSPRTVGARPAFSGAWPRPPPHRGLRAAKAAVPSAPTAGGVFRPPLTTSVPPWAKTPKASQTKTRTAAGQVAKGDGRLAETAVRLRPALHGEGAKRAPTGPPLAAVRGFPAPPAADLVDGAGVTGLLEIAVVLLPADGRAARAEVPTVEALEGHAPFGPACGAPQAPPSPHGSFGVRPPQLFGGDQAASRCQRGAPTGHVHHLNGTVPEAVVAANRVATGSAVVPLLPCPAQMGAAGAAAHPVSDQAGAWRPPPYGTDPPWARRF